MSFPSLEITLNRLKQSKFRARFTLHEKEQAYLNEKGIAIIMEHAADFIHQRLAPAYPKNDGKQTPWKGHPVFIAQHATATCCRGCLEKWHKILKGHELSPTEQDYILTLIQAWLENDQQSHQIHQFGKKPS